MKSTFLILSILFFCGCAAPIMQKTSDNYAQSAHSFINAGEWGKALEPAKRAVINADSANISPEKRAVAHYEYGRILGATCSFAEAESELKKAYELDNETKQPLFLSLTELARLNLDQEKYREASDYFGLSSFTRFC